MRLIDADALKIHDVSPCYGYYVDGVTDGDIEDTPTIDAVPVIRCKDCRFYAIEYPGANPEWHLCRRSNCERLLNDFCSRAERKEE